MNKMTDIDKRIDEIMEYIREIDSDFFCTCCESSDADRLICVGGIIAELQAQVVEREGENKHLKATIGAIQSLRCQFEGGVADAIKEFTEAALTKTDTK